MQWNPGFLYESILFTYEIQDFCINPWYYDEIQNIYVSKSRIKKKKSTVFDGFIDCIHDCIHDSIIQMDTDMVIDRYRYRYKYRWIQIQIDRDTDTDRYRYNMDGYRWINCLFHMELQI